MQVERLVTTRSASPAGETNGAASASLHSELSMDEEEEEVQEQEPEVEVELTSEQKIAALKDGCQVPGGRGWGGDLAH